MSTFVDLTGLIDNGMWHYPYPFLTPEIRHMKVTADWGPNKEFYLEELHMNTLVGTYFETPAHLFEGAVTVDQWPVKEMNRKARLLKVPKHANEAITLQEVKSLIAKNGDALAPGDSLVFATGWDKMWDEPTKFVVESPYFEAQLIEWLLSKEISFLAADIPSFDNINAPQGFMRHLFQKGVVIVAPLVNVMAIPADNIKLYVFPLKIKGSCASPCRVIGEY